MALERLANVERELRMLKSSWSNNQYGLDVASMRSILSPAMQGSTSARAHQQLSVETGSTPIYNDHEGLLNSDSIDSLSLRRDLSCPENPPFGMWWTFTIEETLVWPILGFSGNINAGLDALLDSPDEDKSDNSNNSESIQVRSPLSERSGTYPQYANRGLDDGITVHELVESYIKNIHIQNPVLDPLQLKAQTTSLIENGLGWNGEVCQVVSATI